MQPTSFLIERFFDERKLYVIRTLGEYLARHVDSLLGRKFATLKFHVSPN